MLLSATCILTSTGCVATYERPRAQRETYQSPQVEGQSARINLEQVEEAFFNTRSKDNNFQSWMSALEKRVNEIYEGPEIVSLDASRETGKLVVTGYVEDRKQQGYQSGEEKLFSIEQTGDAVNNQMPYKVANGDGQVFHEGSRSILDNPFIQMMLFAGMLNMWGGRYFTPMPAIVSLGDYRDNYRQSSSFARQRQSNRAFQQRYQQRVATRRPFGGVSTAPSRPTRSWQRPTSSPSRGWGMRRPSSGIRWGGRRR